MMIWWLSDVARVSHPAVQQYMVGVMYDAGAVPGSSRPPVLSSVIKPSCQAVIPSSPECGAELGGVGSTARLEVGGLEILLCHTNAPCHHLIVASSHHLIMYYIMSSSWIHVCDRRKRRRAAGRQAIYMPAYMPTCHI
jgi:hypothetical protein